MATSDATGHTPTGSHPRWTTIQLWETPYRLSDRPLMVPAEVAADLDLNPITGTMRPASPLIGMQRDHTEPNTRPAAKAIPFIAPGIIMALAVLAVWQQSLIVMNLAALSALIWAATRRAVHRMRATTSDSAHDAAWDAYQDLRDRTPRIDRPPSQPALTWLAW